MPFCYSGLFGVWVGCMYAEINFVFEENLKNFQSNPISVSLVHVQESRSLKLDITGHQDGQLKNRSPSLILLTAVVLKMCHLTQFGAYYLQLIGGPFSAGTKNSVCVHL